MKKIIIYYLSLILFSLGCSKEQSTVLPEQEEAINFSFNPDSGNSIASSLSSDYAFKVNVISKIPSGGIKLNLYLKKEVDGSVAESKILESKGSQFDLSVSSLLNGVLYNVTVTIESKNKPSNSSTKSFKIARK